MFSVFPKLQVNANGIISFGNTISATTSGGSNFNTFSSPPIIVPFWNDIDVRVDGTIFYRRDTDPNSINLANQAVRSLFPEFPEFDASLLFVATWDRVARFGEFTGLANTFQAVIASDGTNSFVRFTYGNIEWGDGDTLIGVSAGDRINFITHPLSLTPNVTSIDDGIPVTFRIDGKFTLSKLPLISTIIICPHKES